jgi:hypothetical protein
MEIHVVRTNDAWSVGRLDGMARRPNGWNCGQMSVRTGSVMRIETQVPKNKVFKTQVLKIYLTLKFIHDLFPHINYIFMPNY